MSTNEPDRDPKAALFNDLNKRGIDSAALRDALDASVEKWSSISLLNPESNKPLAQFSKTPKLEMYTSHEQKKAFFRHFVVDEPRHLISVLSGYESNPNLLFRGMSQARYRLYTSLQRHLLAQPNQPEIPYKELWRRAVTALRETNNGLILKYLRHQGIGNITDLGALAFLQHHGCPTPLLDWTYDLRKALWFMVRDSAGESTTEISNYASLYAMRVYGAQLLGIKEEIDKLFSQVPYAAMEQIEETLGVDKIFKEVASKHGTDVMDKAREMFRDRERANYFRDRLHKILDVDILAMHLVMFVSDKDDMPDLALRLYNNLNLVNQDGGFFLNSHPFWSLEEVLEGVKLQSGNGQHEEQLITCLDINRRLFPLIRRELEIARVNEETVFPDPYKICKDIARVTLAAEVGLGTR